MREAERVSEWVIGCAITEEEVDGEKCERRSGEVVKICCVRVGKAVAGKSAR